MKKKKRKLEGWEIYINKERKKYTGEGIFESYVQERIMDERLTHYNEWR